MAKLVQVELWSDFIAAGGVRTRVLPISEIFGALLDEDFNGRSELSLNVNARLAELFGGSFGPVVAAVFSQTTDGRVCQDNFTRADSNTIGAPVLFPPAAAAWTELGESGAGDLRILTNEFDQAVDTPATMLLRRSDDPLPTEFIIQATLRARVSNAFLGYTLIITTLSRDRDPTFTTPASIALAERSSSGSSTAAPSSMTISSPFPAESRSEARRRRRSITAFDWWAERADPTSI